jgi:hypothetical protein
MQRRRNGAAWLGLGLGVLAVGSFFVSIIFRLGPPALRDTAIVQLVVIGLGLGVSVVGVRRAFGRAAIRRGRVVAPTLGALNLGLAVFFVLLLFPFSTLPATPDAPPVGRAAPDFTLADQTGTAVQLAALHGKNVLLVFYRGHW